MTSFSLKSAAIGSCGQILFALESRSILNQLLAEIVLHMRKSQDRKITL